MAFWVMEQTSPSLSSSSGNHRNRKAMVGQVLNHVPNSRLWYGSIQQRAETSVQAFHTMMLDCLFHAVTCRTTVQSLTPPVKLVSAYYNSYSISSYTATV